MYHDCVCKLNGKINSFVTGMLQHQFHFGSVWFHQQSFQEDKELDAKLDKLLAHASMCQFLSQTEQIAVSELSRYMETNI